jgi:membrane protease YdiL (CAAX protease family)
MSESTHSVAKSAAPREESTVAQAPAGVAWRHVALFALLSYAIAWALILPFIPNVFDLISADKTPAELDISIVPVFAMFAPMVAALVMRLFVSKEGLNGSLGPVRKWRFYGLALVLPAVLVTLAIGVVEATGWGDFTWDEDVPLPLEYVVLAVIALTFGSVLTFGEEYGWRGYLLPKLLPLGEVKAAVIVGLIWGPWHAPMLAAGLNYSSVNPLAAIGIFVITATALSLLLSRAFLAAGGALLVPVLMHASFNRFGDTLTNTDHLSGDPLLVTPGGLVGIALILLTVVIAHAAFRRRRGGRRSSATPVALPDRAAS